MKRSLQLLMAASLTAVTIVAGTHLVSGAGSTQETVFVPVTPCRLVDTRPDPALNTGPRDTAIGTDTSVLFNAHDGKDSDSPCQIPATATALNSNTVANNPSARSFITLYPGDVANPGTANLNQLAGQAPTPSAAVIPLAADGSFNVYNAFGSVNVVIDINGYYQPSTATGSTGPAGPAGAVGSAGATGPRDLSAWDTIPSGMTVSGDMIYVRSVIEDPNDGRIYIAFPGIAPTALTSDDQANYANQMGFGITDGDASCTGSVKSPTARGGKVCIDVFGAAGITDLQGVRAAGRWRPLLPEIRFASGGAPTNVTTTVAPFGVDVRRRRP